MHKSSILVLSVHRQITRFFITLFIEKVSVLYRTFINHIIRKCKLTLSHCILQHSDTWTKDVAKINRSVTMEYTKGCHCIFETLYTMVNSNAGEWKGHTVISVCPHDHSHINSMFLQRDNGKWGTKGVWCGYYLRCSWRYEHSDKLTVIRADFQNCR